MKSIRIGNDIRIVWPIVLSGDVSKLKDLDLTVEVRPSKKIVDVRNYADSEINKVNSFKKTETTILMNGGVVCRPDNGSGKECCDVRPLYDNPQTAPVKLTYTIENNTLIAIWPANKQFATGDYDIVLYGRKNKGGQTVCDQYRFVRLVSHTAQIDNEDNCGIEPVITMQPTTVELSGLSAYEVAVLEGFSGTREEWVESLKQPAKDAANEAEENFKTYQLETDKKVSEFVNRKVTPEMLSESTKQLIEASGGGTITNLADDEDIESVDDGTGTNVLKFKDRAYSPSTFSGKGYKILRKNIVDGKNLLTQDMINEPNTRYIIQYDFDLNEQEITIPEDCILDFQGGSFNNGSIISKYINLTTFNIGNVKKEGRIFINNIEYTHRGNKLNREIIINSPLYISYGIENVSNRIDISRDISINRFQCQITEEVTIEQLKEIDIYKAPYYDIIKFHVNIDNTNKDKYLDIIKYILQNHTEVNYITINNENVTYVSTTETAQYLIDFANSIKQIKPEIKIGLSTNYAYTRINTELYNILDFIGLNYYPSLPLVNSTDKLANCDNYLNPNIPLDKECIITECGILPYIEARTNPVKWNISQTNEVHQDINGIYTNLYYKTIYSSLKKFGFNFYCIWYIETYTKENIGEIGINNLYNTFIQL